MANNKFIDREGNVLLDLTGDTAGASDVVTGKTFHDKSGAQVTGTYEGIIPAGKLAITVGSEIDCSQYAIAQVSDANLVAANIKSGVTILGVTGTHAGSGTLAISTTGNKDVGDYKYAYIDVANIANLDPANIVKDVTILGVTGTAVAGTGTGDAKLNTPSIALGSLSSSYDYFYIYNNNNGNFVTYYDIYNGNTLLTTVSGSTGTVTVNLREYITVDGTYTLKVVARGIGMTDSDASSTVSYTHYTYVTVTNTLVNCSSNNSATSTTTVSSYSATLTAASGYSFIGATVQITMGGVDITSTAFNEGEIYIASVSGNIEIIANYVTITQLATPQNVALSGDTLSWSVVTNATSYGIYANGALKATTTLTSFDMSTLTFGAQDDYAITVTAIANGYTESNPSSESITYTYVGSTVDTTLANNDWATIKATCQAGEASSYWSLGDTKNITVNIGGTDQSIAHAIVDMTANRYEYASDATKKSNVVFQSVPTIGDHMFNSSSNTSPNSDTAYNGWDYSQLRAKLQTGGAIFTSYDSTFTALLEQVKTMAAYSGKTNTLVYSNDLLFVPAAREVKANYTNVQSCEVNSEQTQYGYYYDNGNDGNANRIKYPYNSQSATYWWLRSPSADYTYHVRRVYSDGDMYNRYADSDGGVAPCFAW